MKRFKLGSTSNLKNIILKYLQKEINLWCPRVHGDIFVCLFFLVQVVCKQLSMYTRCMSRITSQTVTCVHSCLLSPTPAALNPPQPDSFWWTRHKSKTLPRTGPTGVQSRRCRFVFGEIDERKKEKMYTRLL